MNKFEVVVFDEKNKPKKGLDEFLSNIRKRYTGKETDDVLGDEIGRSVLEAISMKMFEYLEKEKIKYTVIQDSFYAIYSDDAQVSSGFVKIKLLFNLNYRFYGNAFSDFFTKNEHHILYSAYYENVRGKRFFALKHDTCPLSIENLIITEEDRMKYSKINYINELKEGKHE